jgi:hypothetical protein
MNYPRIYLETDGSDGGQKPVTLVLTLMTVLTVLWTAEISCTAEPDTSRPAGGTPRVFSLFIARKCSMGALAGMNCGSKFYSRTTHAASVHAGRTARDFVLRTVDPGPT